MKAKLENSKGINQAQRKAFSLSKDENGQLPRASRTMYGQSQVDTGFIKLDQQNCNLMANVDVDSIMAQNVNLSKIQSK